MKAGTFRCRAAGSSSLRVRGVSLVFALMAVVVLALASVALVRAVDTGVLVMGNLAFKQDTVQAAAVGTDEALAWLQARAGTTELERDAADGVGYYAASHDSMDATGNATTAANPLDLVDWGEGCSGSYRACDILPHIGTSVNGNIVRWVITRLCDTSGAPSSANACIKPAATSVFTASERGELLSGGRISSSTSSPYYRIVVRVEGPRRTVSFTETVVHF